MRIALISYDAFEGRSWARMPPLHLCALATMLEDAGHEVRVFDYAGPLHETDQYFAEIADYRPRMAGLTCFTRYLPGFHRVTSRLAKALPGTALVAGGAHPTAWPAWTLEKMPQFDYAMVGECDYSVLKLAEMMDGKLAADTVPGLVYRDNGQVRMNPRDAVGDLSALPQLRRSFLDRYYRQNMYWNITSRGKVDMLVTSRGCPYGCSFCFKVERRYRFRSTDHVMAEFEELRRRGVKTVHVQDDAFTVNKKRCHEICAELARGKFGFHLKVRSRVNNVDMETLQILKKAGVKWVVYGFESGSQAVLNDMNKATTVEQNRRAVELTRQAGLVCQGDIMIGMPAETPDTIRETTEFLKKYRVLYGGATVLYPLPATKVYDDAKANGMLVGDWDVNGGEPWVRLPWASSPRDMAVVSARMSREVMFHPRYVWEYLRSFLPGMEPRHLWFLAKYGVRLATR